MAWTCKPNKRNKPIFGRPPGQKATKRIQPQIACGVVRSNSNGNGGGPGCGYESDTRRGTKPRGAGRHSTMTGPATRSAAAPRLFPEWEHDIDHHEGHCA